MSYSIGGTAVNSGLEKPGGWFQFPTFGRADQRSETFPGSGDRFVGVGEPLPGGVVVEGWLSAANIGALKTLLDSEAARMGNTGTVTVAVNGASYTDQFLAGFDPISGVVAFNDAGTTKVAMKVRYTWVGVTA